MEIPNEAKGGLNKQSGSNILTREVATCKTCGLAFMVVDWLPWRTEGYCSKACQPWRESLSGKEKS